MGAAADPVLLTALALAGLAVACLTLVVVHREALRRVLLAAVDPRPLALFRIAFGVCLLLGALEAAPIADALFSDEGLLTSAAARQVYGGDGLAGYGAAEAPAGFADLEATLRYLAGGRWSLHFFWDSPAAIRGAMAALVVACVGLIVGLRARACAIVCWLLFAGLLRRGDAHWGGEQVYLALLFPLMLARSGEALSVDNWRRCRALRRRGLLSAPGGAGDGAGAPPGPGAPAGLAAIYRRIPAWPQALLAIQLAILYGANGWAKSGALWRGGDALHYVLHLDKYTRLEWGPMFMSLGTWPLRLVTWAVLGWERLFPLLLVGLWLRAAARAGAPPPSPRARRIARAAWVAIAAAIGLWAALGESGLGGLVAAGIAAAALLGAGALRPAAPSGPARLAARLARALVHPRLWLGFGVAFHLANFVLFNVGMFAPATLSAYLVAGAGPWAIAALQRGGRRLAALGVPVPSHLSLESPIRAEDPALPHLHRDAAALPGWAIAAAGGLVLAAVAVAVAPGVTTLRGRWVWHGAWLLAAAGLIAVGWRVARRARAEAALARPWAYGPAGRTAAAGVLTYHLVALLLWQLPAGPRWPLRDAARGLVDPWMELTFTRQRWQMFAPDPPRENRTLRTLVVDGAGQTHDLRTELERPENLVRPYLWPDRRRKVDEAVSGQRPWLARWHARALCRRWALDHRGEPARAVRLERVSAPMPAPGQALAGGFWAHARAAPIVEIACADEPFAQLDAEVRARHGLGPPPPGSLRITSPKGQASTWAERRRRLDPLALLWPLAALALALALARWAREDRRRHVAQVRARRPPDPPEQRS